MITIGNGPNSSLNGNDIILIPGQGINGGREGSIIFKSPTGLEMMRINSDGITIFGQLFKPVTPKHQCHCSLSEIMAKGCHCGGE